MLGPTHRAFSIPTTAGALLVANHYTNLFTNKKPLVAITQVFVIMAVSYMASTLPDIDQVIPFIRHRGITHSIWAIGLIGYLAYINQENVYYFTILLGFFIGYTGHTIGDAYSNSGNAFLYPLTSYKEYKNGKFHVKGRRILLPPLYKVGKKTFINPVKFWKFIGAILSFILITQLI